MGEKAPAAVHHARPGIQAIENFVKATPLEALRSFGSKAVISMAEMLA